MRMAQPRPFECKPGVCGLLLDHDPCPVVAEAKVDQAPEVDCSNAHREPEPVALNAPVADPAVPVGDQPGDRALNHGSPLAVDLDELTGSPGTASFDELCVVGKDLYVAAVLGGG